MDNPPVENQGLSSAAPQSDRPHVDLFCPRCAYPLVKVEELGMHQCPDCGTELDFEALRQLRATGLRVEANDKMFWGVILRPRKFMDDLPTPSRYVFGPEAGKNSYAGPTLAPVSGGVLFQAVFLALAGPPELAFAVALFWTIWIAWLIAGHAAAKAMLRRLLQRAAHPHPSQGADRITYFASPVYLLLAAMFVLSSMLLGPTIMAFAGLGALLALLLFGGPYVLLWLYWSYIVMLGFRAETRGTETGGDAFWAFANPGLFMALTAPVPAILGAIGCVRVILVTI